MLTIKIDPLSALMVRWPSKEANWLALGRAFVAREQGLPAGQQLIYPTWQMVQGDVVALETAVDQFQSGKSGKIKQSGDYKSLLKAAQPRLDFAFVQLKAKYYGKEQELAAWGLVVKSGERGAKAYKPTQPSQWLAFLEGYVQKETSLAATERLTDPPLAEISGYLSDIQAAKGSGLSAQATREAAAQARQRAEQRLAERLQVACVNLVMQKFNGLVDSGLQHWGYDVAEVGSKAGGAPSGGGAK